MLSIHASNATWFVANQEAGPATILARSNNSVTIPNRSAEEAEDAAAGARQEASAGLSAAQYLNSDLVDVTLIDRRKYHLFQPLLYKARRVGRKGRMFVSYKFRTMVLNADKLKADLEHMNP